MSAHLSVLELELVVCGEGTAERQAHVDSCAQCAEALRGLRADQSLVGTAPYERAFQGALASVPRRSARRRLAAGLFVSALAAAAVLVMVVQPAAAPEERLKGGLTLTVLDAQDEPAGALRPKDRVGLVLSGATDAYLAVFAIEAGQVTPVWPTAGRAEARPTTGRLPTDFEVTEGAVDLVVLLGPDPFPIAAALDWLTTAAHASGPSLSPEALRGAVPSGMHWASARLVVRGEP